jgi:hypothetical protein
MSVDDFYTNADLTSTATQAPTSGYDASVGTSSIADLIAQGVIPKPPSPKAPAPVHAAYQAAVLAHPPTVQAAAQVAAAVAPVSPPRSYTALEVAAGLAVATFAFWKWGRKLL